MTDSILSLSPNLKPAYLQFDDFLSNAVQVRKRITQLNQSSESSSPQKHEVSKDTVSVTLRQRIA